MRFGTNFWNNRTFLFKVGFSLVHLCLWPSLYLAGAPIRCIAETLFFSWILCPLWPALSLTHPQSPMSARCLETLTTTLLTDGHLTFRGRVSVLADVKTASPLPRPFRCWWRTTPRDPLPSPGPSPWTRCWRGTVSLQCTRTVRWNGRRIAACPAMRRSSTSTWTCYLESDDQSRWASGSKGLLYLWRLPLSH